MCGIMGLATRQEDLLPWLVQGLSRLEYRGYDSAGVALLGQEGLFCCKSVGPLSSLRCALDQKRRYGQTEVVIRSAWFGMAHTRWATHGAVTEANAHPQSDGQTFVVHNGIIENVTELRQKLPHVMLTSQTDTEILVHMITQNVQQGHSLRDAVRHVVQQAQGTLALVVMNVTDPDHLVVFRRGSPLSLARLPGGEGFAVASDVTALTSLGESSFDFDDEDLCEIGHDGGHFTCRVWDGQDVKKNLIWTPLSSFGGVDALCDDLTWKEMNEQPAILCRIIEAVDLAHFHELADTLCRCSSLKLTGCGSSYYASLIGQYMFESLAGQSTQAELASEFRYRRPVLSPETLCLFLSQSGETLDTLQALVYAQQRGVPTGVLTNVAHSSMAKKGDVVVPLMAGPEVSVVSTKAFTAQLAALVNLLVQTLRRKDENNRAQQLLQSLGEVPEALSAVLRICESEWQPWIQKLVQASTLLFLGRGILYPLALEGALKLKETAYLHAEGYPAGEMKHGPIALIDPQSVCVLLAPSDELFPKILSNAQEILARGGTTLFFTDPKGQIAIQQLSLPPDRVQTISVAESTEVSKVFVYALLCQILAYKVAKFRGCNIDRPRNLAKSVTVE